MNGSHNSNDPRDYERFSYGRHLEQFELQRRNFTRGHETLVSVTSALGPGDPPYVEGVLVMPIPDGRLVASLDVQFVPADPNATRPVGLDSSLVTVQACTDLGGSPKPVEDLYGTVAAPVRMCGDGLWGFTYSPTEEVECLQLTFVAVHPGIKGRFAVRGRWHALYPIDEQDWSAVIKCCALQFQRGRVM